MTICLAMIVKDESVVIERCLASALPHIDSWLIIDTGSRDNTVDLVRTALSGVPGDLIERRWRDFGSNRTELMRLARGRADWLLCLDADMVVEATGEWRTALDRADIQAWLVEVVGGPGATEYAMPYLIDGHVAWRFEGVTHEYLATDQPVERCRLDGLRVRHHADGGSRSEKFTRDRALLEAELRSDPTNSRTVFYLAQTCADMGERHRAIELYAVRAGMAGWDEETFVAQLRLGVMLLDEDWPAACAALLRAYSLRPSRAEPLYWLARGCRDVEQYAAAYLFSSEGMTIERPADLLFVDSWIYDWGLRFERSVAAWYVGRREEAHGDMRALLHADLPEEWRTHLERNLRL